MLNISARLFVALGSPVAGEHHSGISAQLTLDRLRPYKLNAKWAITVIPDSPRPSAPQKYLWDQWRSVGCSASTRAGFGR